MTSTSKVATAGSSGCDGWVPLGFCGSCSGDSCLSDIFPTIFVSI